MTHKNVRVLLRSERWCKKFARANGWVGNDFWDMLTRFHGLNIRAYVCSTNFEYPEHGQNRIFEGCRFLNDVARYHQIDSLGAGENVATADIMLDITHAIYTTAVRNIIPFAGSQYMIMGFKNVRMASFRVIR